MPDSAPPGIGQFQPSDAASEFNYLTFVIQQLLGRVRTAVEVQVVSCTNSGTLAPFGLVTVQPVVRMQDGGGFTQAHGTIYNLLYFRLQGGKNAIICDPQKGDLGVAFVLDRDTSSAVVNATGLQSGAPGPDNTVPPGSSRRFSLSDGFYVGGNLNVVPTQYLRFSAAGIELGCVAQANYLNAGLRLKAVEISDSSYQVEKQDFTIFCFDTPCTVTLLPSPEIGRTYRVKNATSGGIVTVVSASGTIDGQPDVMLGGYGASDFEYNGVEWSAC